jgi:hypothetical protein
MGFGVGVDADANSRRGTRWVSRRLASHDPKAGSARSRLHHRRVTIAAAGIWFSMGVTARRRLRDGAAGMARSQPTTCSGWRSTTLSAFASCLPDTTIGASFQSAFDSNVAPSSRHIEVREGDACAWGWSGEPIEVLFLDMVKTWPLNDLVLDKYFPFLIPGHSVIVQQDYLWGYAPWIQKTMELLEPSVAILDSMPKGSVAYLLTAPVPEELIGHGWARCSVRHRNGC